MYGLGGGDLIVMDHETIEHLQIKGCPPESYVLRHFMYFGPLPQGLLSHVDNETWTDLYQSVSVDAERVAAEQPTCRFENEAEDEAVHLTPEAKHLIFKMMRLVPAQRASIDEILEDP